VTSPYAKPAADSAIAACKALTTVLDLPSAWGTGEPIAGERTGMLAAQVFSDGPGAEKWIDCLFVAKAAFTIIGQQCAGVQKRDEPRSRTAAINTALCKGFEPLREDWPDYDRQPQSAAA
jgi:hypothetical protein